MNVKWVKDYIKSLTNVTCIMVSHDSGLLNDVCNHILEIADLKLSCFKGNLAAFVKVRPEARAYFELKSNKLKFHFPRPGPIEGVKAKGKALIKVVDVSFKYPRNDKVTIEKATVQVSLSSRVACIGPNGAGKSTLIKCLTGEVQPTTGTVWQHPNATKCDDQQAITEVTDAYGNFTEIKAKKTLTKKEIKKMTKEIKAKIKSGAELDEDEEAFAEEHELWK